MSNPSIETAAKARIQIRRLNMATLISVDLSTPIIFGHASCFVREITKQLNMLCVTEITGLRVSALCGRYAIAPGDKGKLMIPSSIADLAAEHPIGPGRVRQNDW
jgi:hypothetical protein